jgi:hypothetical protein
MASSSSSSPSLKETYSSRIVQREHDSVKIDEKELEALNSLKGKLVEEGVEYNKDIHPDWSLLRWLRARGMNIDDAFQMFTKSLVSLPLQLFIHFFIFLSLLI